MKFRTAEIRRLFAAVAEKTKTNLDYASFRQMYDVLEKSENKPGFRESYLYKSLYCKLKEAEAQRHADVALNTNYVHYLAAFLGYTSFDQFLKMKNRPREQQLETCRGTWYSYVRIHTGGEFVLRSPVEIYSSGNQMMIRMKGAERMFTGELHWENNCIYSVLESNSGKKLQLVFRTGINHPKLLQGVFSGVSSAGIPIAGREILVRTTEPFDRLSNKKMPLRELQHATDELQQLIGYYFRDKNETILRAGISGTFDVDDLELYRPVVAAKPGKKRGR